MAKLADIAVEAGVSTMTVSNVVNGKHSKVSDKTIKKVNKLIKKYNYVPNSAARALSSKSSKIIAVFLPNEDFDNPHNIQALASISKTIKNKDYRLMIFPSIEGTEILSSLKSWNVDGVICFAPLSSQDYEIFKKTTIPTCFIDSYFNSSNIMHVGIDDYNGGYLAADYLAKCGHTNIGFASYYPDYDMILTKRLDGFKEGCLDNGLTFSEENIFIAETTFKGGVEVGKQIAESRRDISAVFSTEDAMAIGVIEGARSMGMDVPDQLSVIGFDNTPICQYITPKLTTIDQDILLKGEKAASMLLELIEEGSIDEMSYRLPVKIVERQSVKKLV